MHIEGIPHAPHDKLKSVNDRRLVGVVMLDSSTTFDVIDKCFLLLQRKIYRNSFLLRADYILIFFRNVLTDKKNFSDQHKKQK